MAPGSNWFQRRRLQCKSLGMMLANTKWWQYITWPFGSSEVRSCEVKASWNKLCFKNNVTFPQIMS
jgi:hypothetical protein